MKRTAFYGDSIFEGFKALKDYKEITNLGLSGEKTINLIGRFVELVNNKPESIFMMIGINDILVNKKYWQDYININYKRMYETLLILLKNNFSHKNIHLISILPININIDIDNDDVNNIIVSHNEFIKEMALKYDYTYIDMHKHFLSNKHIKKDYTYDGVHLTEKGYLKYLEVIKEYFN